MIEILFSKASAWGSAILGLIGLFFYSQYKAKKRGREEALRYVDAETEIAIKKRDKKNEYEVIPKYDHIRADIISEHPSERMRQEGDR